MSTPNQKYLSAKLVHVFVRGVARNFFLDRYKILILTVFHNT